MTDPHAHAERVAQAEQALAFRLRNWGVTEPERRSHEFISGLLREGWRPWAAITALPPRPAVVNLPPAELIEQTRARLRAARPHTDTEETPNG